MSTPSTCAINGATHNDVARETSVLGPAARSALFDLGLTHLLCGAHREALVIARGLHAASRTEPASVALLCLCLLANNRQAQGEQALRQFETLTCDSEDALAPGALVLAAAVDWFGGRPEEGAAQLRQYLSAARVC